MLELNCWNKPIILGRNVYSKHEIVTVDNVLLHNCTSRTPKSKPQLPPEIILPKEDKKGVSQGMGNKNKRNEGREGKFGGGYKSVGTEEWRPVSILPLFLVLLRVLLLHLHPGKPIIPPLLIALELALTNRVTRPLSASPRITPSEHAPSMGWHTRMQ